MIDNKISKCITGVDKCYEVDLNCLYQPIYLVGLFVFRN